MINLDVWLRFPSKILKAYTAFSLLLMVKCERDGNKLRKDKEEKGFALFANIKTDIRIKRFSSGMFAKIKSNFLMVLGEP